MENEPTTMTVPAEDDPRIVAARNVANEQLSIADLIVIDSDVMNELANTTLSDVHHAAKELEKKKQTITGPLSDALSATRALFRPAEDALETAKNTLKRKIGAWLRLKSEEREKAERAARIRQQAEIDAAREAAEKALIDAGMTVAQREEAFENLEAAEVATPFAIVDDVGDMGSNSSTRRWKASVTNLPAFLRYLADDLESKAPKFNRAIEAKDVKVSQLQEFAKSTAGTVTIPGITFVEDFSITARKR